MRPCEDRRAPPHVFANVPGMLAEFMIPGVSAHVLLVFTLVHRRKPDDPVPRDIFLGQAVLGLQSLVALTIGERECTLDLGDIEVSDTCR